MDLILKSNSRLMCDSKDKLYGKSINETQKTQYCTNISTYSGGGLAQGATKNRVALSNRIYVSCPNYHCRAFFKI